MQINKDLLNSSDSPLNRFSNSPSELMSVDMPLRGDIEDTIAHLTSSLHHAMLEGDKEKVRHYAMMLGYYGLEAWR
ncbi:hypothetical protein OAP63_13550 [Vibrio sp.]|uniref:Uncharacterized protein n=1 Tax=Vibrio viridaestus TaxID=2487322 RepID=A0A3N9TLP7_9VIBR|nr:hypothetical protein [Vibrio viridaestus]MDC0611755.1 hypothetical protein [Vibrio sp.]RQW64535.1 hypothetical protein EES38_00345 [Vibrio viridaestus]